MSKSQQVITHMWHVSQVLVGMSQARTATKPGKHGTDTQSNSHHIVLAAVAPVPGAAAAAESGASAAAAATASS